MPGDPLARLSTAAPRRSSTRRSVEARSGGRTPPAPRLLAVGQYRLTARAETERGSATRRHPRASTTEADCAGAAMLTLLSRAPPVSAADLPLCGGGDPHDPDPRSRSLHPPFGQPC